MKDKQERFCQEFLSDLNAAQAAVRAGYSERTAKQQGSRLLTNADVQARVTELQQARSARLELDTDGVVQELAAVAFQNLGDYVVVEHGVASLDLSKASPEAMRAFKKISQREVLVGDKDDGGVIQVTSVETHDKLRALDLLMRHLGGYAGEKRELSGPNGGPITYLEQQREADRILSEVEAYEQSKRDGAP